MAERRFDLSGRKVELPDGSTFEFAWDLDVYPIPREQIEEHGLPKRVMDGAVDDVIGLADMVRSWRGLTTSELTTEIGILWEMHHRIDCLLHALTVTMETKDVPVTGRDMAMRNVVRVRDEAYRKREFCDLEPRKVSPGGALLDALLGGLGDER